MGFLFEEQWMKHNLRKAWQVIDIYEEVTENKSSAQKIVTKLDDTLRPIVSSNKYFKVKFEKDHGDHGIIILKYANVGKDATPKEAEDAKHIMVSFEGFDKEGNVLAEDGKIVLHFFKWNLSGKNPGKVKGGCQKVTDYFIRWFKSNLEEITKLTEDSSTDGGDEVMTPQWDSTARQPVVCPKCKKMKKPIEAANSFRSTIYDAVPQEFCACKVEKKEEAGAPIRKVTEAKKKELEEEGEGGVAPGTTSDGGPVQTTGTTTTRNLAAFRPKLQNKDKKSPSTPANRKEIWQNISDSDTGGYETKGLTTDNTFGK